MKALRWTAYGFTAAWALLIVAALWIDHTGRHPYGY